MTFVQRHTPRHQCHTMLNEIVWRSNKRMQIPEHKELKELISRTKMAGQSHPDTLNVKQAVGLECRHQICGKATKMPQ